MPELLEAYPYIKEYYKSKGDWENLSKLKGILWTYSIPGLGMESVQCTMGFHITLKGIEPFFSSK